jgi:CrcB protein
LTGLAAISLFGPKFPFGTLTVNVVGCFVMGGVMYVGLNTTLLSETARITFATGVLGGLTTYSAFNYETLKYFLDGNWSLGVLYVTSTLAACGVAGLVGLGLARQVFGPG